MDVNFNPLTGFKRPYPGAQEEPHRAVRARPESALGQGGSTSGGGEPDSPLPAPGNLSAWEDSLPSFNFPPDTDWETPPASPTESVELSTILSELQGEPAQGRDIASAPVFAGHATEAMEAFDLRGHLPMDRTGEALLRSQNAPVPQQAPQLPPGNEPDSLPSSMEDLSAWVDSLLSFDFPPDVDWETPPVSPTASVELSTIFSELQGESAREHDTALEPLPTSPITSGTLSAMLRELQGQPEVLLDTATSMSRQGSDAGRPAPAFAGDATGVEAAHQGRQSPRQNPLHRNLLAARERLAAGSMPIAAARELNIDISTLVHNFDRHGHLMINDYGRRLLQSRDAQVARQARQLPRALTQVDLDRLTQALLDNAGREPSQLHTALQNLPNPVSKEALEFLIDAGGLRADRLAQLPDEQRQALEAAHQGRQIPFQNPLHRNLLTARQRLAAGARTTAVALELNIPKSTLANTFDRHGRLLINDRAKTLLQSRDVQVAPQAQQLPRALTQTDLNKLTRALRDNAGREPSQLHAALQDLPNPVAKEALAFLVDAGGLRADRLALLPDAQRQALEAAHQGRQSPFQNPLHRNLLAARERLAAGATAPAAVRELNILKGTLTHIFDRRGRLMINRQAKMLLQSQDAQVVRQARQLPRALTSTDLDRLIQALRDNAGREPRQLLAALQQSPNPVTQEALAFLVDAGGLRADRLALLPDEQRQALEAVHQGRQSTLQNPSHRNLLAARQHLAAGATAIAAARELNIPRSTLTNTFDRHGHLMINGYGRTLLRSRDEQVARQARQLPRALVQADLNRLTQALRDNAGREPSQLHTALRNLPTPVAQEALAFLLDAGGLRADRLALLPDEQRQLLEEARSVQDLI